MSKVAIVVESKRDTKRDTLLSSVEIDAGDDLLGGIRIPEMTAMGN